jgi:hypothetical protein
MVEVGVGEDRPAQVFDEKVRHHPAHLFALT